MKGVEALTKNWKPLIVVAIVGLLGLLATRRVLGPVYYRYRTDVHELTVEDTTFSYRDLGTGAPTVVISSGVDCSKNGYHALQEGLAKTTRVIAYDRPGTGDAPPNSEPPTLDFMIDDMKAVLEKLDAPPPYVLIGHSMGAHIIRYYANAHPEEVAGLVMLDGPHEDWFRHIRDNWSKKEIDDYFVFWSITEKDGRLLERPEYETNCDMLRGIEIDPSIPVLMFTGDNARHFRKTDPGREVDRRRWAEMQGNLIEGHPDAKHIIDFETGHWMHRDKPEEVLQEIKSFIERIGARRAAKAARKPEVSPR
ncbi:MAG: alpha/beta hydrolase [Myxococcales bacterium]|nr:alpha/beta hydrolase [Myxococcales bacterium]